MTNNPNTDVDKLISFGQMAFEQGWYDQARDYFEQALELAPSNREAMKGLARANEILSRRRATPVEPKRPEPVKPLRKVPLEPIKPKAEPARPKPGPKLATMLEGKGRWLALASIPVLLLIFVFAYQRIKPMAQPTPTPMPTSTPRPTPRPTATLRYNEWLECKLAAVGNNDVIQIELLLIEFTEATARLDLNAINISPRTIHVSPLSFVLVDSTGASVNYTACNFRGRSSGIDVAPGTYTTGRIQFFPSIGEPRKLVYDDGLYDPIVLNISLASCVRVTK